MWKPRIISLSSSLSISLFQKNLVVWKHEADKPASSSVSEFQKNLVVWKHALPTPRRITPDLVSEELSSVETI